MAVINCFPSPLRRVNGLKFILLLSKPSFYWRECNLMNYHWCGCGGSLVSYVVKSGCLFKCEVCKVFTTNKSVVCHRRCCGIWKHHRRVHLCGDAHAPRCQRPPDSCSPSSERWPIFLFPWWLSGSCSETGSGKGGSPNPSWLPVEATQRWTNHRSRDIGVLHHWRSDPATGVCGQEQKTFLNISSHI